MKSTKASRSRQSAKILAGSIAALLVVQSVAPSARAANVTWDPTPGAVGAGDGLVSGGAGTWDPANALNGSWTVDGGLNNIAWNNAANDVAIFGDVAGTVTLASGATVGGITFNTNNGYIVTGNTITFGVAGSITSNKDATINSAINANAKALTLTGAGDLTLGSAITGGLTLTKTLAGFVSLTGTNAFTAGTITGAVGGGAINGGTVTFNAGATALTANGATGANSAINSNVTIVTAAGTITNTNIGNRMTLGGTVDAGSLALTFAGSGVTELGSALANTTTLTKNGAGALRLAGTNAFTTITTNGGAIGGGTITLSNGATALTNSSTTNVNSNVTITTAAGTLTSNGGNLILSGTFDGGGFATTTFTGGGNSTVSQAMSNVAALTKTGTGTLTLGGANTYTGTTTLTAGTIVANNATALGNGGNITFGGGTLQYNPSGAGADYGTRIKNSASAIALNLQGNNVTLGAVDATNTAGLTLAASYGTLTLSSANAYAGVTTISGGNINSNGARNSVLLLNHASALGGGGNISFTGGTLRYSSANTVDYSARIVSSTGPINLDTNGQNVTFASALAATNSGGLAKYGAGDLTFSGNISNLYTGQTTVGQGRLILDNTGVGNNNNNRIADASSLTLFNGATFLYKGSDDAGVNSTESIANINNNNFGGNGIITVSFGGTNLATLTATGSFGHSNNNGGTFLVNGVNLGKNNTDVASVGKIIINTAPTLTGTSNALASGINAGVTDTKIVPFLVGEATATTGGLGTATGVANTFVTYVAGSGLRPLNPTDEFVNNAVTATKNTYITAATASSATAAINSLVINGGNLSIATNTTLTNTSGATLFASNHAIDSRGALAFGATEAQITVNAGVTGTIGTRMTGTGGLTKSGAGNLNLNNNMLVTGGFEAEGGGVVNLTQGNQFSGNFIVGGFSGGNTVHVSGNGTLWSTVANTLDIGANTGVNGNGGFGNNTVDVSATGAGGSASLRIYSLMLGGESSNNNLTVRNGANLRLISSGNATWHIGAGAGSNNNVLTVTGAGSELSRGPAQGSAIQVGNGGSNNGLVLSAGAHLHTKRIVVGASSSANNNYFTITGLGTWYDNAYTQLIFGVGNAAFSSGNVMTVADQAIATIDNSAGQNNRNWSIGAADGADNNAVVINGLGTQMRINHVQPWALGATIASNAITDSNAKGNHLDITGGASLIPTTATASGTSIYLMGVQSALNLGDGTNISTARVGGTSGFVSGVYMPSADARLNINSGRMIAHQAGLMVSGLGQIQLNGPAYFSTTFTGVSSSIISSVIAGGGNLIKEGSGNLIIQAANTYTGATVVNAGTLSLDHTSAGTRLAPTSTLTLGSGTVDLYNGAATEIVASTSLTAGRSNVTRTAGSSVLRLNALTPGVGIVNFGAASIADTDNTNDGSGILGAWATVGGTDWAINSTNAADGAITAYANGSYTNIAATGSVIADGAATNVRFNAAGGGGNVTLGAATTTVNTLLQSDTSNVAQVDTIGGVLATNGIMISAAAGTQAVTIGVTAGDGSLQTATAGANLVLNNNQSSQTLTINAPIVANGASGLATAGAVTLNGVNTYTGATGVGGTLTIGGAGQLNSGSYAGAISLATTGSLVMNTSAAQTLSGVISGDGTITQLGSGTTTLSGANTYTGATSVTTTTGGILVAANATAFGNATTASLVFGASTDGKVQLNNSVTVVGLNTNAIVGTPVIEAGTAGLKTLTLNAIPGVGGAVANNVFGNNSNNYAGVLQNGAGTLALVKSGTGTLRLGGVNTYSGGTTINGGVITLGNKDGFGLGDVTLASTTMIQQDTFAGNSASGEILNNFILGSGDAQSDGEVLVNIPSSQQDMWITGNISGSGRMRVISDGSGRSLTLSGAKSFTGGIVQSSGAIQVGGTQTNQYPTIQIDNVGSLGTGTFRALINGSDLTRGLLTSAADLSSGSGVTNNFAIGNAARLIINTTNSTNHLKLSGVIAGEGNLHMFGAATLTLTGTNTYIGTTTLTAGTVSVSSETNLGNAGAVVFNGGTLQVTGTAMTTLGSHAPTFVATKVASYDIANAANTFTVSQTVASTTGGLTKMGAGVLSLTANNSGAYTGLTNVAGGVLLLNNATAVPGGIATVGGTSRIEFNGGVIGLGAGDFTRALNNGLTDATFVGAGGWAAYTADRTVNLGGATGTIDWDLATTGFNGQTLILGAATADKTVTLVNPLLLSVVSQKTLQVDNGSAANDAILSGNISSSAAGAGITKTGAGSVQLNGTQGYDVLNATAGTTNVNGALGFTAGAGVVTVSNSGTKLRFGTVSQTLTSLTIGAGSTVVFTSGAATGSFTGGGEGGGKSFGGGAVVPEPGTLGLLIVGALGMLGRRRRA